MLRVKAFSDSRKKLTEELKNKGIYDEHVLNAFQNVPRHMFVPYVLRFDSYKNTALPIGKNQTISQPSTVAFMTQELNLKEEDMVLEVGTGSGFQTAILADIAAKVYTIEVFREFAINAEKIHKKLGITNIIYKIDNGTHGWKEFAPFDKIIVTAALDSFPETLVKQLNNYGILIFPFIKGDRQQLIKVIKNSNHLSRTVLNECNFVTAK